MRVKTTKDLTIDMKRVPNFYDSRNGGDSSNKGDSSTLEPNAMLQRMSHS